MTKLIFTVASVALLWVGTAGAATDEERCLAGRAKAKGKYEACVEKWLASWYGGRLDSIFDDPAATAIAKLAKCRVKYAQAWTKLQKLDESTACGGQPRYVDNGNGTITDNLTGLVWEKKSDNGDIHDMDIDYTWSLGSPYHGNGEVFTPFLTAGLNTPGFAGANDWRLPTFAELQTIALPEVAYPCSARPCVDAVFNTNCVVGCSVLTCSCTEDNYHLSSTTSAIDASVQHVWIMDFWDGLVTDVPLKVQSNNFRAVRGGF